MVVGRIPPSAPPLTLIQAREKEHKDKPLGPDIFQWGWWLPPEGVGVNKLGMSLETKLVGRISRGTLAEIPVVSKLITDRHLLVGSNFHYRYRMMLPEEVIAITETDLWEFQQKVSHYGYRFSLEFQLHAITDTDRELATSKFCNHFGCNSIRGPKKLENKKFAFDFALLFTNEVKGEVAALQPKLGSEFWTRSLHSSFF